MNRRALFCITISLACSVLPAVAEDLVVPDNQAVTIPLATAEESLAKMKLPAGFKASVFASEPELRNPVALSWDGKGRLWIAENYTYSDGKERFNMTLHDRILIFDDRDNDGRFDEKKVFSDQVQMLTSIEHGFGGVYAMCPPHLLWIPDANGDHKPDGPPVVVLDGFSTQAASRHTFANGLKWGPDGWLYGRVGISSTSYIGLPGTAQEKRQPTAGGIWRYHPIQKVYEPVCHGTTNPWGMDWDENGEAFFINTVIGHFWHMIPGAHLKRMHGADPYPHIYGQIEQHADHYHWDTGKKWTDSRGGMGVTDGLGGGHAHVGMMIYQGANWPKEYRGKAFTLNLHGRRANVERLEPEGSGYVAKHEPDMLKTDDPWFRGVEISYGPDGGVYVLDWSDLGECHEEDGVHRNSGRVYKITYGDAVKPKDTDVTKLTDAELVILQSSQNEWQVRMARRELWNRVQKGGDLSGAKEALKAALAAKPQGEPQLLNLWWTELALTGGKTSVTGEGLTAPHLKQNALRLLSDKLLFATDAEKDTLWASLQPQLKALATTESTPALRLGLASFMTRHPESVSLLAPLLLSRAEDAMDHNLPLMYWFGIKDLPPAGLVKLAADCRVPLVTEYIARRITEETDRSPGTLDLLLASAGSQGAEILRGMTAGFKGWRKAKKPAAWDAFAAKLAGNPDAAEMLRDLNVLFGDGRALDEVRNIALDDKADASARRAALETLIEAKSPDLRQVCDKLLTDRAVSLNAVRGLATFDDPKIANRIIGRYKNFYQNERSAVLTALVSRPSFARELLAHLSEKEIPRTDLTALHARQIRSFNDEALTKQLAEVWGEVRESSADKMALISTLKTKLTPASLSKADQSQGRMIYSQICAMCHKLYGEGAAIGPDLTGSGRHDLGYLLENIADPGSVVAADYRMTVLTLKDGRILNGIIHGQTDRTLTITMVGQETTVDKSEIVKQEQLPVSMMPEGLMMALGEDQVRNLVAYLMGRNQVELPAAN